MNKTVIITVHGIMTSKGEKEHWQNEFDQWLHTRDSMLLSTTLVHEPFSYGWLGPINSWLARLLDFVSDFFKVKRLTRRVRIERFKKFLIAVRAKHPNDHIHVIAHSFGAWIAKEAIEELPKLPLGTVTLVGAVVSSWLKQNKFDKILTEGKVGAYNIWSSHNDAVTRFMALPPFGHLGYWGLLTDNIQDRLKPQYIPYKDLKIYNNHREYTHSGYFDDPDVFYNGVLFDIFNWEDKQ